MKPYLSMLATASAAWLVAGCVTLGDQSARFDYLLNKPLDEAVARLGPPRQDKVEDGKRVVTWDFSYDGYLPAAATMAAGTAGSTAADNPAGSGWTRYKSSCRLAAEVDQREQIVNLDWAGEYCDSVSNQKRHRTAK